MAPRGRRVHPQMSRPSIVFKIVKGAEGNKFVESGLRQSPGFGSDIRDGFIHLSTESQLVSTFTKKFEGADSEYALLAVDLGRSESVKWELAKNGEVYPHLYSSLDIGQNILWARRVKNCADILAAVDT